MSNVTIGRIVPGAIACLYHIQCAGCNECRELDMLSSTLPIIEDSLRAKAVRQGFHLMPFSLQDDKWFCTACAESRGPDAKVFTAMRQQAKSAAFLKSKASDEKSRAESERTEKRKREAFARELEAKKRPPATAPAMSAGRRAVATDKKSKTIKRKKKK